MPVLRPALRFRPSRRGTRAFVPLPANDRLAELGTVGDNPGRLSGRLYVPADIIGAAPLIVVLHGCTQNAALYDHGSGWSALADKHRFILLFPEQVAGNNPMLCFNWFQSDDNQRGLGEAASIASMIAAVREKHQVDSSRIYVTGLSAGGAMAGVMLATYPELFAAGAIIAGMPYGCASGVVEAFDCMGGRARNSMRELGAKVRRASPHKGSWPRVQIWHGSADTTVVPANADAIALQWASLHEVQPKPARNEEVAGYSRRIWLDVDGRPVIEQYLVTGMAHGVPLDLGTGEGQSGAAGAHMLDVGLSSTNRIAAFFGIAPEPTEKTLLKAIPESGPLAAARQRPEPTNGVQSVIEKALKAAGLMR